jgi:hypothetical protein
MVPPLQYQEVGYIGPASGRRVNLRLDASAAIFSNVNLQKC